MDVRRILRKGQAMPWTPCETHFIDYLCKYWVAPSSYLVMHASSSGNGKRLVTVNENIEDMSKRYTWRGDDFAQAVLNARTMSITFREVLNSDGNCHELHHQCLAILEWGGLPGVASSWLRNSCSDGTLRGKVVQAVTILKQGGTFVEFDGERLLMNAGVTKIYAMAAPDDLIIYDGRVGAALGLLVRRSLVFGATAVPDELQFPWGSGQGKYTQRKVSSRNPNRDGFNFPYFDNSDASHARWCHKASAILREVRDKLSGPPLRQLEMGLFMIGYAVNGLQ
jgi:hypothetical protein